MLEPLPEQALSGYDPACGVDQADQLRHALAEPDYKRRLRYGTAWLGGIA